MPSFTQLASVAQRTAPVALATVAATGFGQNNKTSAQAQQPSWKGGQPQPSGDGTWHVHSGSSKSPYGEASSLGRRDSVVSMRTSGNPQEPASEAKSDRTKLTIRPLPSGTYGRTVTPAEKTAIFKAKLDAQHVVVKIGTATVTNPNGSLNTDFVRSLAKQTRELVDKGIKVSFVVSGAVNAGRNWHPNHAAALESRISEANQSDMSAEQKKEAIKQHEIEYKQGLAAVGQPILYAEISKIFREDSGLYIAQILATKEDMEAIRTDPQTHSSLYSNRFDQDMVTMINANDGTCSFQLKEGDNDNLAMQVARAIRADTVVLATDVAGLFSNNPNKLGDPSVYQIPCVGPQEMPAVKPFAGGSFSAVGTGGMGAKLKAAQEIAHPEGIDVVMVDGKRENFLLKTLTPSLGDHQNSYNQETWLLAKDANAKPLNYSQQPTTIGAVS